MGLALTLWVWILGAWTGTVQAASDPWDRPAHLRAVAAPPSRFRDLAHDHRAVRLFWDITPSEGAQQGAEVQQQRATRWVTMTTDATSGWTSAAVPLGTAFRVRLNAEGRWSEPVAADPWISPTDIARIVAVPGASLGRATGQVRTDATTGGTWASTLGGGLNRLKAPSAAATVFTRWDGLPDDRVVAVAASGGEVLAGTARGAVLLDGERVLRVWDASLPDPYVQAVGIGPDDYWFGTYQGLARWHDGEIQERLAPWSVFSIQPSANGAWVGYDGLTWVPREGEAVPVGGLGEAHVYDLAGGDHHLFLATEEEGVRLHREDGLFEAVPGTPTQGAYGLAMGAEGLWVAASGLGLFGPQGQIWGRPEGLPSSTAWSVAAHPGGGLWVATEEGLALLWTHGFVPATDPAGHDRPRAVNLTPVSSWPADTPARALLLRKKGAWMGGPDGVRILGRPHRHAANLVVGAGPGVIAVMEGRGGIWAVGRSAVRMDGRGRLHQVALPIQPTAAAIIDGVPWVGGVAGLWRYDSRTDRFRHALDLPEVERLVPGDIGLWAVARGSVFHVVAGGLRPFLRTHAVLDVAPAGQSVWVGTENGLERILLEGPQAGEVVDVLGDADGGVAVPAVAADGQGGCWFAAEDGTVGRVSLDGQSSWTRLPQPDPPRPTAIVPDGDAAWVLTRNGTWRVTLPAVAAR